MIHAPRDYPRIRAVIAAFIATWQDEAAAGLIEGLETRIKPGQRDAAMCVTQGLEGNYLHTEIPAMLEECHPAVLVGAVMDSLADDRMRLLVLAGRYDEMLRFAESFLSSPEAP